jgi:hypothetical protein
MYRFKSNPDLFKEIKRKWLLKMIPLLFIASIVGISISIINSNNSKASKDAIPISAAIIFSFVGIGVYLGIRRKNKLFNSYILTIENNEIKREQLFTPTISIAFDDIIEISKNAIGSFIIKGYKKDDVIIVPKQIENYLQLESILHNIKPITIIKNENLIHKYQSAPGFLAVGLIFSVYTSNNKIIVGLSGTLLIALMVWSVIKIRRSKNVDTKTKRIIWWVLIVIGAVVVTIVNKIMAV